MTRGQPGWLTPVLPPFSAVRVVPTRLPLHGFGRPVRIAAVPPAPATRSTTSATRSAPAARPAPAAATRAGGLRIRDLHRDPAAVELAAVQLGDGRLGLLRRVHFDEPESPGLAGEAIGDHRRGQDVATL